MPPRPPLPPLHAIDGAAATRDEPAAAMPTTSALAEPNSAEATSRSSFIVGKEPPELCVLAPRD